MIDTKVSFNVYVILSLQTKNILIYKSERKQQKKPTCLKWINIIKHNDEILKTREIFLSISNKRDNN